MLAIFCSILSNCRTFSINLHNCMQFILIIRPFGRVAHFVCWNVRIWPVRFNSFVVRFIIVGGSPLFFRLCVWIQFGEFSERWCNRVLFLEILYRLIFFIGRTTFTILNLYFYYLCDKSLVLPSELPQYFCIYFYFVYSINIEYKSH